MKKQFWDELHDVWRSFRFEASRANLLRLLVVRVSSTHDEKTMSGDNTKKGWTHKEKDKLLIYKQPPTRGRSEWRARNESSSDDDTEKVAKATENRRKLVFPPSRQQQTAAQKAEKNANRQGYKVTLAQCEDLCVWRRQAVLVINSSDNSFWVELWLDGFHAREKLRTINNEELFEVEFNDVLKKV